MKATDTEKIGYILRTSELDVSLSLLADMIANYFDVDEQVIFKRDRRTEILKIRYMFMSLAKVLNKDISFKNIGYYCKSAHKIKEYTHATVLNACREAKNFYDTDENFKFHYDAIRVEVLKLSKLIKEHKGEVEELKRRIILEIINSKSKDAIFSVLQSVLIEESERLAQIAANSKC